MPRLEDLADQIFAGRSANRMRVEGSHEKVAILSLKDVGRRLAARSSLEEIPASRGPDVEKALIETGDVVVTARGAVVRAAVALKEHDGIVAGANLVVVRPKQVLNAEVLAAYLRHPRVGAQLLSEFAGSATPGFTVETLKQLDLSPAPPSEARLLADFVTAADDYAEHAHEAARLRQEAALEAVFERLAPTSEINQ